MNVQILGTLQVEIDGVPVDLGAPKQRALLAILVLHANQVVSTDRLIDLIWSDNAPRTAAHSIQIYISALRKALPDGDRQIETRAPGYIFRLDPDQVDANRLQALIERGGTDDLRTALSLWAEPLADFQYEEWAQPHIRRLHGLEARAVEALAASELEDGRPAVVPDLLHDLIRREPLREEPRRLLMLALSRTGRQAEALRSYREFRSVLGEEMGVEPSPDLAQLEEQILLQDPSLLPTRAAMTARGPDARNPFKGLGAFDEIDSGDFFGRDKLVGQMADALSGGSRLLVVVGPSGSGKSSAVRAGLIPALRQGRVADSDKWILATMTPGRHPFEQLEAALLRMSRASVPSVLEQLVENETGLLRVVLRMLPGEKAELLLVVDQFEELFTLAPDQTRRRFLDNLVTAVTDPRSRVRVVVTLRADFYDRPLLSHRFAPVFAASVVNVIPLSPAELEQAIVEPAAGVGVSVEPPLLAQLVADMSEEAVALPLLQYALTETFVARKGAPLSLGAYQAIGGLQGALTARADQLFDTLDSDQQELAGLMFLHMVGLERGSEATRRRVTLDELRGLGEVDELLGIFISGRLLSADRDPLSGRSTIQVTHEALLERWERLRGWIEANSTDLERRSALTKAATEWDTSGRDDDYLLTGGRLSQLDAWSKATQLGLSQLERDFIDFSLQRRQIFEGEDEMRRRREAAADRRARRRLWWLVAALVLLSGAVSFAILAAVPDPLPPIAFVTEGRGDGGIYDDLARGFDLADAEEGIDAALYPTSFFEVGDEIQRLAEGGVQYIITFHHFSLEVEESAANFPDTKFTVIDFVGSPLPNVQGVSFAQHEGSYLVGAIAALRSKTSTIGFVGGVDFPLIYEFQAGFEAGARAIDPDIDILVTYLAPEWDFSGFASETLAQIMTEPMYQAGADVIYHAAGHSGQGVFQAAVVESERQGRHLWAIGVDSDEFMSVLTASHVDDGGPDPQTWQPHILTSMTKGYEVAVRQSILDFAAGRFSAEPRLLGLADDGVGYSVSGGFVDDLVPQLEDFRARIISGEIVVPTERTP